MEITYQDIELGKRAISLENFRLTSGMACFYLNPDQAIRYVIVLDNLFLFSCGETSQTNSKSMLVYVHSGPAIIEMQIYPLLRAPSTRGCLLELVREAWNLSTLSCTYEAEKKLWEVSFFVSQLGRVAFVASGATEEEALLNALEMATK